MLRSGTKWQRWQDQRFDSILPRRHFGSRQQERFGKPRVKVDGEMWTLLLCAASRHEG